MTKAVIVLARVLLPIFLIAATARAATMKLLAPETGWALAGPGLMWTTDGGADWTNITPPLPAREHVSTVFFLNTHDGWVLLTGAITGSEAPRFDIATTVNSGATWSVTPFEAPGIELAHYNLSGGGHLFFLDTLNGWANLDIPGMSRPALLLETHDGGGNWGRPPSNPNVAGELRFINSKVGWILGGPSGDELYATRNGGESWKQISLGAAVNGSPVTCSANGPPHFTDGTHGYFAASCMGGAIVLFGTVDAGKTWNQQRVLTGMGGTATVATSVADATLIAGVVNDHTLTLFRDTPQGVLNTSADIAISRSGVNDLSFADTMNGWALLWYHHALARLYSTSDGGHSWTDITPQVTKKQLPSPHSSVRGGQPLPPLSATPPVPLKGAIVFRPSLPIKYPTYNGPLESSSLTSEALAAGSGGGGLHTSIHIGFDSCFDKTKVNQQQFLSEMQAWWTYSPYYDYGLYIGGVNTKCLLPTDSSTVNSLANQGWGIMPLWVGLQAPCTPGFYTFSDDPTQAASDGRMEADNPMGTIAKASTFGLSKAVIYYDFEPYDTTNDPNCGPSVTAFIGAWVSEMQRNGYSAGVYVGMYGARDQVSKASPQPNEVWISKWDNRATIWGLGVLNDTLWTTDQRAHQFLAPHDENWGNVQIHVDSDIEDTPAAGSNGSKSWAFTAAPSSVGYLIGTNDIVTDPASGQLTYTFTGQFAGLSSREPDQGMLYDPNTGSTPIVYGAWSDAYAVDNQDKVVGDYNDFASGQVQHYHGLIRQSANCGPYDYPGTTGGTMLEGVNDDGQIVGDYYYGSAGNTCCKGFLLKADGTPQPLASGLIATGINGQGEIVGNYYDNTGKVHGFLLLHPNDTKIKSIDCDRTASTFLGDINNNQQIVGKCYFSGTDQEGFIYDNVTSQFTPVNVQGTTDTEPSGINDWDQVVGGWGDGANFYGFTANH